MRYPLLCFLFLTLCTCGLAQSLVINELHSANIEQSGAIEDESGVTGYYFMTRHEKERRVKGKKKPQISYDYHLELYDVQLNKIGEKVYRHKEGLRVSDVAYNGKFLAVKIVDHENERKRLEIVDATGETVRSAGLKYGAYDEAGLGSSLQDFGFASLNAVPGGFFSVGVTAEKKLGRSSYFGKFISNDPESKGWMVRSSSRSKDYEAANFIAANDSLLLFNVFKRPNMLSQKYFGEVKAVSLATGKPRFTFKQDKDQPVIRFTSGSFVNDQIVLIGMDVGSSNKIYTDKPEAFNAVWFDLDGTELRRESISFEQILGHSGVGRGDGNLYLHKVTVSEDGQYILAGELYKSFNGGLSSLKGLVVQLDADLNYVTSLQVEKGKSTNGKGLMKTLEGGISLSRKETVALMAKASGDLDFAMMHRERDAVSVAYFEGRRFGSKDRVTSVFVVTAKNGKMSVEKVGFEPHSDYARILPNRTGFITIVEFDRKGKKLVANAKRMAR